MSCHLSILKGGPYEGLLQLLVDIDPVIVLTVVLTYLEPYIPRTSGKSVN